MFGSDGEEGGRTNPSMQATSQAFLTCLLRFSWQRGGVRAGSPLFWQWEQAASAGMHSPSPRVCKVREVCGVTPACITRINGMKLGEGESCQEVFPQGESY